MIFFNKTPAPEKLNICIIAARFPILGRAAAHGFLWPIAKALVIAGHKVTVLSWKNPLSKPKIEQDGVEAYFLGQGYHKPFEEFSTLTLEKFTELHKKNPFHVVHCIDEFGLKVAEKKRQFRVAVAFDADATQMSKLFALSGRSQESVRSQIRIALAILIRYLRSFVFGTDRKVLKWADGVFVTSPQQKVVLERYYLYPELKTFVVPYGIDVSDLEPRKPSDELRKELGIPGSAKVVVTFTDMTEMEEIKNLFLAFEKVAIKKPASRLIVIGNGPLKKQIEFEMLNLALGSKVVFTGHVANVDVPNYIALADIFVNLSSRTSGFEPTLLEAMAQKKVIIGSEVSPISTIVEDGAEGFLVRPADKQTLATLILQVFTDQIDALPIGERARQKILGLFESDKMLIQTLSAYKQTMVRSGLFKVKS